MPRVRAYWFAPQVMPKVHVALTSGWRCRVIRGSGGGQETDTAAFGIKRNLSLPQIKTNFQ